MGKTNQERIRRQLAQSYEHMNRVMDTLAPIAHMFAEDHDEMAELLRLICVSMEVSQGVLETFCMKAWGRVPENWETWRNPKKRRPVDNDGQTE